MDPKHLHFFTPVAFVEGEPTAYLCRECLRFLQPVIIDAEYRFVRQRGIHEPEILAVVPAAVRVGHS
jgi:hypothetical protein